MNPLREWLAGGLLIADGAWGTEGQAHGLDPGAAPDTWNLTHPERVEEVARACGEAGSHVILTNTFRANAVAMNSELDAINRAGVAISKRAAAGQALVLPLSGRLESCWWRVASTRTKCVGLLTPWQRLARMPYWWRP